MDTEYNVTREKDRDFFLASSTHKNKNISQLQLLERYLHSHTKKKTFPELVEEYSSLSGDHRNRAFEVVKNIYSESSGKDRVRYYKHLNLKLASFVVDCLIHQYYSQSVDSYVALDTIDLCALYRCGGMEEMKKYTFFSFKKWREGNPIVERSFMRRLEENIKIMDISLTQKEQILMCEAVLLAVKLMPQLSFILNFYLYCLGRRELNLFYLKANSFPTYWEDIKKEGPEMIKNKFNYRRKNRIRKMYMIPKLISFSSRRKYSSFCARNVLLPYLTFKLERDYG